MEQKQNNNNQQKVKKLNTEFVGEVIEVFTGDSLQIKSVKFNNQGRFCLTNVKAPQIFKNSNKPYAFESKEYLRKLVIGQQVKVKMEYEKSFQITKDVYDEKKEDVVEIKENKKLIFALVEFDGKQLAVEMLKKGLVQLQKPYTEDEKSAIYEELEEANQEATKKKINLHSKNEYKPQIFRDYSMNTNHQQASALFPHLRDNNKLTGVVELVLNGSRFKVRLNNSSCYIILVLHGVRCLPNDENFPGYTKYSNKALEFSKYHLLQRDVEVKVERVDKKGIFQGKIMKKKVDYAQTLLQEGLATIFGDIQSNSPYYDIEAQAKEQKKGIWSENLDLAGVESGFGGKQVQQLNKKMNVQISEFIDVNEFYLQQEGGSDQVNKIYNELSKLNPNNISLLNKNVKAGTPCLAKFFEDGLYYRAKVVKQIVNKVNTYQVHFFDYGNYANVSFDDMRKMPEQYLNIPPQADKCALAYVVGPNKKHPCYNETANCFWDRAEGKQLSAQYVYKYGDVNHVILNIVGGSSKDKSTVNEFILREGLVKLDTQITLPQSLEAWKEIEDAAKEKGYGAWDVDQDQ